MKSSIKNALKWIKNSPFGLLVSFFVIWAGLYLIVWQYLEPLDIPAKERVRWHIFGTMTLANLLTLFLEFVFRKFIWRLYSVTYQTHIQNFGWSKWVSDGEISGNLSVGSSLEAIRIKTGERISSEIGISYQVYIQHEGWQNPERTNGQVAGSPGRSLKIEGIKIDLINAPNDYSIIYKVRLQGNNWSEWKKDGEVAGTEGQETSLEGIRIMIAKA
jgi:Clostridial hydrophobic W